VRHLPFDAGELLDEHRVESIKVLAECAQSQTLTVDVGALLLLRLLPDGLVPLVLSRDRHNFLEGKGLLCGVELNFTHVLCGLRLDSVYRSEVLRVGQRQSLNIKVGLEGKLAKVNVLRFVEPYVLVVILDF
jgi:hypothetical protein